MKRNVIICLVLISALGRAAMSFDIACPPGTELTCLYGQEPDHVQFSIDNAPRILTGTFSFEQIYAFDEDRLDVRARFHIETDTEGKGPPESLIFELFANGYHKGIKNISTSQQDQYKKLLSLEPTADSEQVKAIETEIVSRLSAGGVSSVDVITTELLVGRELSQYPIRREVVPIFADYKYVLFVHAASTTLTTFILFRGGFNVYPAGPYEYHYVR